MLPSSIRRCWPVFVLAIGWGGVPAVAAVPFVPADTDVVLTFNLRKFLEDHKQTDAVQEFLEPMRQKSVREALGLNPLEDIDRVTCAFQRSAADSWVVIGEGRFHQERLRPAVHSQSDNDTIASKLIPGMVQFCSDSRSLGAVFWRISH
jgi:hypothetical protein